MSAIASVAKKEFRAFFQSPIAYVFITLFLVLSLWIFFFLSNFFLIGQSTLRTLFDWIPITFLIFVPAVTMRMWAEEQKLGTAEILLTFPVRDWEVVLGKFLAGLSFLAVAILLTLPLAGTIAWLGNPDDGAVVAGYLGSLLVGATYLAIGLWVSSLTQNQIVAFLISVILCFVLYIVGVPIVLASLPDWLVPFVAQLSLGSHFDSMGRGVIDSRDVIYYVSIIFFFLFLNVQTIASRRWS
ncbi:MAG: ABC transporter permease subunit [Candidatus Eisenbacteria bacterium]